MIIKCPNFRFIRTFLDECDRVLSTKLLCVEQKADENKNKLDQASRDLENLENIRKRVIRPYIKSLNIKNILNSKHLFSLLMYLYGFIGAFKA